METKTCKNCGGNLTNKGDYYVCERCANKCEATNLADVQTNENLFSAQAIEKAIATSSFEEFKALITNLSKNEVDKYIDYNLRFAKKARSFELKKQCAINVLGVDESNADALKFLLWAEVQLSTNANDIIKVFETTLKYSNDVNGEVVQFLKGMSIRLGSKKNCEVVLKALSFYQGEIELKESKLLLELAEEMIENEHFDSAERILSLILPHHDDKGRVYWNVCLVKSRRKQVDLKSAKVLLKDIPEFKLLLTCVSDNELRRYAFIADNQEKAFRSRIEDEEKKKRNKKTLKIVMVATPILLVFVVASIIVFSAIILPKQTRNKFISNGQFGEIVKMDNLTEYVIPDGTTEIKPIAFSNCKALKSVTIPDSVTKISQEAFAGCSSLESITIPNSVTSIGDSAFWGCSSLTSVTFEDGSACKTIGENVFGDCSMLVKIEIPSSVHSLGDSVFTNCSSLETITIGDGVISIESNVFKGCTSLTSVTIGDGLTSLGENVFKDFTSLISVTIGNCAASIGENAFSGCSGLENLVMGNGITSIGESAFRDCTSLKSVEIPDSVTSISPYAFFNCSSLTSVIIPNSVTSIGNYAFYDCASINSLTIGNGVQSIGNYAFYDCTSLNSLTIGNSVQSIGSYAFFNCSGLTSLAIPDSVKTINEGAFRGCSAVKTIVVGNGVTSIGRDVFMGCANLEKITLPFVGNKKDGTTNTYFGIIFGAGSAGSNASAVPGSLKEVVITNCSFIDANAFINCASIKSISIPNSVTSIGASAFAGCSELETLTLPFIGKQQNGVTDTHLGFIFGASSYNYNSTKVPKSLKNVVVTGTTIGSYAFYDCNNIENVSINNVTSIGASAFWGCSKIKSIEIPNGVYSISINTFENCFSLESVLIPNSVVTISANAFSRCTALRSITIPSSVTSIGVNAFQGCSLLTIYCQAQVKPEYWTEGWNSSNCSVVWGA